MVTQYNLEYKDQTGEFKPFNVAPSLLTIVSDEVLQLSAEPEPKNEEVDLTKVEANQKVDIIGKNYEFYGPAAEREFYVKAGEEVTLSMKTEEGMHGLLVEGLGV